MNENTKHIIEINDIKLEVDTREARKVEQFAVGSRIKVLIKGYSDYAVYAGTIVGFDNFPDLPTIQVAYIDQGYSGGLHFKSYNAKSTDIQIVSDDDNAALEINKGAVLDQMTRQIAAKQAELETLERTREFFLARFGAYFGSTVSEAA